MNQEELKKFTGPASMSLVGAMKTIDQNAGGLLDVLDKENRLNGSLTDGDIRRWMIKTGKLDGTVGQVMNPDPKYVHPGETGLARKLMEQEQIYSVAVVNDNLELVDIMFHESCIRRPVKTENSALSGVPVIIMAGGKGTRLYPYTKILPKPLIPIGDVPILERIMNRFYQYGAQEFYLTVNYKKEIIRSYFADAGQPYTLHYIEEHIPLGTAGSISLIQEPFDGPVIVTNCDILIQSDYGKIMDYHKSCGNDMTIISSLKNIAIPYGVLRPGEQGTIRSMEEKPRLSYFINTGMYIVNPEYLKQIPENRVYHMTDLAEKMLKDRRRVGMYPVSEHSFLDMGEFEEMKKMEERMNSGDVE